MRSPILFLSLVLSGWLLGSCRQEADLPTPFREQLVVQGFISPQDSLVQVSVSKNHASSSGSNRRDFVTDAAVSITPARGGVVSLRLLPLTRTDSVNRWCRYGVPARLLGVQPGGTYALRVRTPGGLEAEATCTVPSRTISADDVSVRVQFQAVGSQRFRTFRVAWPDAPGGEPFYSLHSVSYVEAPAPSVGGKTTFTYVSYGTAYLSGAASGGQLSSVERAVQGTNAPFEPKRSFVQVYLCQTDRNYYYFNLSLARQQQEEVGNLFPEPVPIAGNVRGGLGVFAGYTLTVVRTYL